MKKQVHEDRAAEAVGLGVTRQAQPLAAQRAIAEYLRDAGPARNQALLAAEVHARLAGVRQRRVAIDFEQRKRRHRQLPGEAVALKARIGEHVRVQRWHRCGCRGLECQRGVVELHLAGAVQTQPHGDGVGGRRQVDALGALYPFGLGLVEGLTLPAQIRQRIVDTGEQQPPRGGRAIDFPLVRHPAHRIPERLQEHIATAIDAVVLGPDREHNVLAPHVGRHLDRLAPVVPQGQRGAGVGDADAELTCMRTERVAAEEHHLGVAARGVPGGRHPLVILKGRLKTGIGKQVAALRAGGRSQHKDADQRRETAPGQTRDGAKARHGYPR